MLGLVFGYIGTRPEGLLPDDLPGVRHHDGHGARGRGDVHLHGLRAGERGAHEPAVPRGAAPLRARARLALPRHDLHRDALRGGHRHRRRLGHHHRADGRAGDDALGLRREDVRGHDLRGRHARHPHPAQRDAGGDGAGALGLRRAPVRGRAAAGPAARGPLPHLHDGARVAEPEARAAAVEGRARRAQGPRPHGILPRPGAADRAHHRDAGLDRDRLGHADRRRRDRLRGRARS